MYSELRRAYQPTKRGQATVLHLSESADHRFGSSLVIQPLKVVIGKRLAGLVWAAGTALYGKLGLNVRPTACVETPHQLTDLPLQTELQRYMSKVPLRSVPFRPKSVVPVDLTMAGAAAGGPRSLASSPQRQSHHTLADDLAEFKNVHVRGVV